MLKQWSSFAIISIYRAHLEGSQEFLVYRKIKKRGKVGTFQFPGGSNGYGDTNPMVTLKRAVKNQTGIDLNRFSTIRRICCENTDIESTRSDRELTKSVRYYQVHIDVDAFIDRTGFEMGADETMQWVDAGWILGHESFSKSDKAALRLCLNS